MGASPNVSIVVVMVSLTALVMLGSSASASASSQLVLLKGGKVYAPEPLGFMDVLIGGNVILRFLPPKASESIESNPYLNVNVYSIKGQVICPGFVDIHSHVAGGGGELGPASRTPEANISEIIDGGVTTVVGLLGTDSVSRSLVNLLTKLNALEEDGITTFMWSGGYRVPVPTLSGSVTSELLVIDKVIGFGEVAISDHRSSNPSFDALAQLVGDTRVGGMLSGKAGKTYFHVGKSAKALSLLWEIVAETQVPISQILPTHVSDRGAVLMKDAIAWLKAGGNIDLTADENAQSNSTLEMLQEIFRDDSGLIERVSLSSDSYGSLPVFSADNKRIVGYGYGKPSSLMDDFKRIVHDLQWPIETALSLFTKNPSDYLQFNRKGNLKEGNDADLLILDPNSLNINYVFAQGMLMKNSTWTYQPMFPPHCPSSP